jgi:hypothetical protein
VVPKRPAASRKKAAASKEVYVEYLKVSSLLSPITPKPSKGEAIAWPKPVAKEVPAVSRTPAKELKLILQRFYEENPGVTLVKLPK